MLLCGACGYYSETQSRRLQEACVVTQGQSRTERGGTNLRCIRRGVHPANKQTLEEPWPMLKEEPVELTAQEQNDRDYVLALNEEFEEVRFRGPEGAS